MGIENTVIWRWYRSRGCAVTASTVLEFETKSAACLPLLFGWLASNLAVG